MPFEEVDRGRVEVREEGVLLLSVTVRVRKKGNRANEKGQLQDSQIKWKKHLRVFDIILHIKPYQQCKGEICKKTKMLYIIYLSIIYQ